MSTQQGVRTSLNLRNFDDDAAGSFAETVRTYPQEVDFAVQANGTANAVTTLTIAAPGAGKSNRLAQLILSFSGAIAAAIAVTVAANGTTHTFNIPASTFGPISIPFPALLKGAVNATIVITIPACGVGILSSASAFGFIKS